MPQRLLWFLGLWGVSVAVAFCAAQLLRWMFGRILS